MESFGKDKPPKYIECKDDNNLCVDIFLPHLPMSECLSSDRFNRLTQDEIDVLDVNTFAKDIPKGCILDVDLEYPKELHNLHNDYSTPS